MDCSERSNQANTITHCQSVVRRTLSTTLRFAALANNRRRSNQGQLKEKAEGEPRKAGSEIERPGNSGAMKRRCRNIYCACIHPGTGTEGGIDSYV